MRAPGAGRKPKPTAVRIAEGVAGHRPLNMNEPKPAKGATCPSHLDAKAKAEWKRVATELNKIGLLTILDRATLASYAQLYSRWVTAEESIARFGLVVTSKKSGLPVANPFVVIAYHALTLMKGYMAEMGLTPSSRARLTVGSSEPLDALSEFLKTIGGEDCGAAQAMEIGVETPSLGRKDETVN